MTRILFIGDIMGRIGRRVTASWLKAEAGDGQYDLIIANGENAAGGFGITERVAKELFELGIDVISGGNHSFDKREVLGFLNNEPRLLRPANYPPGVPGRGCIVTGQTMVVNLIGRTFMNNFDCPFRAMDKLLAELKPKPAVIIVDFHAEATSEKVALGWYLDGRVSAVLGTHTHVGTIDARLLPHGTAYVTDIGMTGPLDSVIGDGIGAVTQRFLTIMPHSLSVGKGKPVLNAIMVNIAEDSGRALSIERIYREMEN